MYISYHISKIYFCSRSSRTVKKRMDFSWKGNWKKYINAGILEICTFFSTRIKENEESKREHLILGVLFEILLRVMSNKCLRVKIYMARWDKSFNFVKDKIFQYQTAQPNPEGTYELPVLHCLSSTQKPCTLLRCFLVFR